METLYQCCCGLDVHKKQVVACLRRIEATGETSQQVRSFSTTTADLLALSDWLTGAGCTHVAMESTGVYWKPIYNLLEGQMELLVVNAQHIKTVPGRKTDVKDAEWIAELLQYGLLKGSFIPPRFQRDLRDLTRYRTTLVRERARLVNRLQKVLEDANLKLASVATDVVGVSGRMMLEALLAGESDPRQLAELARGRLRKKIPQLQQALAGRFREHHRFLIAQQLSHLDFLDESIDQLSQEIARQLLPFDQELELLDSIPGLDRNAAEAFLAEVGPDMSRFPSSFHLASWTGICPGNHESAGKRRSGKTRKGNRWLRDILITGAHAASHTKETYLASQFHRLAGRKGKKKAAVAVGHSILRTAYYLLSRQEPYKDLGPNYFDEINRARVQRNLVRRLEKLGYKVSLEPAAVAA